MERDARRSALASITVLLSMFAFLVVFPSTPSANASEVQLIPHAFCLAWSPSLMRVYAVSDLLIGLSYFAIPITLIYMLHRARRSIPFDWVLLAFSAFIFTCGVTHFLDVLSLWQPIYWASASAKILTALASVATAVMLPPTVPRVIRVIDAARTSETRKHRLTQSLNALQAEVAERRRVEEELREALKREQRLNDFRNRFVTRMSHEFRTPLAVAQLSIDMLRSYGARMSDAQRGERLDRIEGEIRHMTRLLEDILAVGEATAGQQKVRPEPLALEALCRVQIEELQTSHPTHTLQFEVEGTCPEAVLDRRMIQRVLVSLVQNAIVYSPEGSQVEVALACEDEHFTLHVRDEGIGILPADIPYIFDAFYRGTNIDERPGTGLGLAIVKQVVDAHGGTIDVSSTPGTGTTFTVRLPLRIQAPENETMQLVHRAESSGAAR